MTVVTREDVLLTAVIVTLVVLGFALAVVLIYETGGCARALR